MFRGFCYGTIHAHGYSAQNVFCRLGWQNREAPRPCLDFSHSRQSVLLRAFSVSGRGACRIAQANDFKETFRQNSRGTCRQWKAPQKARAQKLPISRFCNVRRVRLCDNGREKNKEKWFDISLLPLHVQEQNRQVFANSLFAGRRIGETSASNVSKSFFARRVAGEVFGSLGKRASGFPPVVRPLRSKSQK